MKFWALLRAKCAHEQNARVPCAQCVVNGACPCIYRWTEDFDAGLSKSVPVVENVAVKFREYAFNVTNHPTLGRFVRRWGPAGSRQGPARRLDSP
jgi:hypothetical protein